MATLISSHVPLTVHSISSRSSRHRSDTSRRIAFSPASLHLSARRFTVRSRLAEPPSVRRDTGNGAAKSSTVIDHGVVEDDLTGGRAIAARVAPTTAPVETAVLVKTPPTDDLQSLSTSDTPWFQAARDSKVQVPSTFVLEQMARKADRRTGAEMWKRACRFLWRQAEDGTNSKRTQPFKERCKFGASSSSL